MNVRTLPFGLPTQTQSKPANVDLWCTVQSDVIGFRLPNASSCNLAIMDMNGNVVKVLVNAYQEAGSNYIDLNTVHFPNGVYFVQIKTDHDRKVIKLIK